MVQGMVHLLLLVTSSFLCGCQHGLVSACEQSENLETKGEEFTQLEDCRQDYGLFATDSTSTNARSTIDCALSCTNDDKCLSFIDYPPVDLSNGSHLCILVPKHTTNCEDLSHYNGGRYYVKVGIYCPSAWTLVYSQSSTFGASGNLYDLGDKIRKGARLRVHIETSAETSIFEVDTAWVYGIDNSIVVTAQVFLMISPIGNGIGIEPHWTSININTTDSKYNLNTVYYSFNHNNIGLETVSWFIKEPMSECPNTHPTTLLQMDVTQRITKGSYSNVIRAISDGYPIQIVENINPVNKDRSYPAIYTHYDSKLDEIVLYGTWIGEYERPISTDTFETESILIRLKPIYKVTAFSGQDILDITKIESQNEYLFPILLTGDFCWEKVFVHDESGGAIFGSFDQLVDRVLDGYNIRVAYTCLDTSIIRSVTIDKVVQIQGNKIIAHAFKSVPFSGTSLSHLKWVHEEIYTTGFVKIITLDRANGSESVELCDAQVTWLAEKKKPRLEWFEDRTKSSNVEDSANFFSFPTATVLAMSGLPRIISQTQASNTNSLTSVESHKIEALRVLHGGGTNADRVFGINGHTFKGTQLAVNAFGSQHVLVEFLFNVDVEAGYVEELYHLFDFVQWYF